jgi:hypothetical protein
MHNEEAMALLLWQEKPQYNKTKVIILSYWHPYIADILKFFSVCFLNKYQYDVPFQPFRKQELCVHTHACLHVTIYHENNYFFKLIGNSIYSSASTDLTFWPLLVQN